ncbi:MAG: YwaF family protein [Clostridia bacterium]|nr:YwaF family protein [Clostridia bacterium]
MREFFGLEVENGGYLREPEGYFSWQHLLFVTLICLTAILLGILLGKRSRSRSYREKNRVLITAALLFDALEVFEIVFLCFRSHDPLNWVKNLPLFLCSVQAIALPMAAFCKGRLKLAALDFVSIFGVLGMLLGTYGAGQNYACYPVLSFNNVQSGLIHGISGFAAIYIFVSGMDSMRKRDIWITFSILTGLCAVAYAANVLIDYNYMFLMRGDGTPYDIVYNAVGGSPVLYPLSVVGLFLVYIAVFYLAVFLIRRRRGVDRTQPDDRQR